MVMILIVDFDQYINIRIVFEFYVLIDRVVVYLFGMVVLKV